MRRSIPAVILIVAVACASMAAFAQARKGEKTEKARDPVCGIMVEKDPDLSHNHRGETVYFCSKADMEKFKQAPDKYPKK